MAFMEPTDRRTPQCHDMAITAQGSTYVARQRSNVGSLAAFGRKDRLVGIGHREEVKAMDFNRARGKLYDLALARDVVRPLACDLYGRKTRWNLFYRPGEPWQDCPNILGAGTLA
jgi:hypothetical protein